MKEHHLLIDFDGAWYLIPSEQAATFEAESRNIYLNQTADDFNEKRDEFWDTYSKHHIGMSPRGIKVYVEEHSY